MFDNCKQEKTSWNLIKYCKIAMNCDIVFSFDTGGCFFYCNDEFNQLFKGSWYHVSTIKKFYDRIFSTLDKNPRIKYIEDSNNYDDIFQNIY